MNKLKTLLVALGLMSFSLTGFASTFTPAPGLGITDGSAGLFEITNFGFASAPASLDTVVDTGVASGNIFFDLITDFDTELQFSSIITLNGSSIVISSINLYIDNIVSGAFGLFDAADEPAISIGASSFVSNLTALVLTGNRYFVEVIASAPAAPGSSLGGTLSVNAIEPPSEVPVPAAGILFASALFGAGFLGRRKKKAKTAVMSAFARAA